MSKLFELPFEYATCVCRTCKNTQLAVEYFKRIPPPTPRVTNKQTEVGRKRKAEHLEVAANAEDSEVAAKRKATIDFTAHKHQWVSLLDCRKTVLDIFTCICLTVWKPSVQANKMCAEGPSPLEPNKVAKTGTQRGRGSGKGGNKGRFVTATPKAETKGRGRGGRKKN
eukprot:6492115-Amphidinium_carterae.1